MCCRAYQQGKGLPDRCSTRHPVHLLQWTLQPAQALLCIGLRLFDFLAKSTLLKHIPSEIAQVWVIVRIDHENLPPLTGAQADADQHAPVKGLWYCKIDATNSGLIAIEDDLV